MNDFLYFCFDMKKIFQRFIQRQPKEMASKSLNKVVFHHLFHDPLGMSSIVFIAIVLLVSILGSLITPDPTPNANRQILEISLQKPGTKIIMLKIPRETPTVKTSGFEQAMFGRPDENNYVPITKYEFSKNTVIATLFKGDSLYPTQTFQLCELLPNAPKGTDVSKLQTQFKKESIETKTYWLGTDRYGRDVLSQLILGSRVSISVGLISVFIAIIIGVLLGSIAGYFRGWVDELIIWFINVVWSIPSLLLVIAISFALGKGFWQVFIAIGLTMWVDVARVVRGQVMSLREKEFVEAGKALGYSNFRIIYKHILPNVTGTVAVIAASNFASAILIESGLSFLGLGVQPPVPSWGTMIKENYGYIILDYAYLAIIPGLAIMLLVLAFMLIGNSLRDALDVKA
jgi:ABC-type dipeptide/oligopeptide/nickel transport system permease subunit